MENQVFTENNSPSKIMHIKTIKEEYMADIFIQIRWREPELDGKEATNVEFKNYWSPKIVVSNLLGKKSSQTLETSNHVEIFEDGTYIILRKRICGSFSESLELEEFPFDVQDLSVVISSDHHIGEVEIVEDPASLSAVNVMCFVDATEWDIYDLVYSEEHHHIYREHPEVLSRNPALAVKTVASRRYGFFIYNMIAITILICSLLFATFSVDIEDVPARLSLSFILTLTVVTFKQASNRMIPRIQYLTYLDRLIIGGLIFTWLTCAWHAVLSQIQDVNYKKTSDFWAYISFLILFVSFYFVFFIVAYVRRSRRATKVAQLLKAYQIKAVQLMGQDWMTRRDVLRASVTKNSRNSKANELRLAK